MDAMSHKKIEVLIHKCHDMHNDFSDFLFYYPA